MTGIRKVDPRVDGRPRRGDCIALPGCDSHAHRDDVAWPSVTPSLKTRGRKGGPARSLTHVNPLSSAPLLSSEPVLQAVDSQHSQGVWAVSGTTLTVRGSAPTQHAIGNWREPTRNNGQTADLQKPEFTGPFKIRTSAMTSGYYRTASPVTALPMIMRWISDVPSKIVKIFASRCHRSTGYSRV